MAGRHGLRFWEGRAPQELAPILCVAYFARTHDLGAESNTPNRVTIVFSSLPEGRSDFSIFRLTQTWSFRSFQYMDGNQLIAPFMVKTILQL